MSGEGGVVLNVLARDYQSTLNVDGSDPSLDQLIRLILHNVNTDFIFFIHILSKEMLVDVFSKLMRRWSTETY